MEMDIPENQPEMPRKDGAKKRELGADEADLLIGFAASSLVGSQGSLNILNHLETTFLRDDAKRREDAAKNGGPSSDYPLTEIERFVRADHPSHLLKIAELEEYIEAAKKTTQIIDETDVSGETLWDFIPDETKDEILNQLAGLRAIPNVKEALQTEIKGICSETWDAHKATKEGTEKERLERLETIILGAEPSSKEKKDFGSMKDEILNAEEIHEMIALEKARLAMSALLASPEQRGQREKEAGSILGEEFNLIKAQVEWMEKALARDTENAKAAGSAIGVEGFISEPLQGIGLVCPELLNRLEGEPSKEQIEGLNKCYAQMAQGRDMEPTARDRQAEKTAFCLAALQTVEMGKKARFMNVLHQIGEVSKEKAKGEKTPPELPENMPPPLPPMDDKEEKGAKGLIKRGAARVLKQWPQMLTMGMVASMRNRILDDIKSEYGSMKDHVDTMKEHGLDQMTSVM